MSDPEVKKLIECPLEYSLSDAGGPIGGGSATGRIDGEKVSIVPGMGEPILFSPREIVEFAVKDYAISLKLASGERLALSRLGYRYEDFSRILSKARNEVVMKDMLMQESLLMAGVRGEYSFNGMAGACELRLFETGLAVMPEMGEPLRARFGDIEGVADGDYSITLSLEGGNKLILSKMGGQSGPFKKALNDAMNELSSRAQKLVKDAAPVIDSSMARRAARYLRDGKAAKKCDLDAISPAIWEGLERKIKASGIGEEYEFLKSIAKSGQLCAGIKRGLMGDMTGDYLWVLAPVYDSDPNKPGNAIIMEAATISAGAGDRSDEEGGMATYVFRIMPRGEYPAQDMPARVDALIKQINDCMASVNFRREPIYLPDEALRDTKNLQYWYSVQRLPSLRTLRGLFIGRVVHASSEQWKKGVSDMLSFNVGTKDDGAKYN